jgi:small subunit ribosomal protein S9
MNNLKYTFAVGRRKSAVARVRLFKGTGENLFNGKKIKEILNDKVSEILLTKPFKLTRTEGKYYFWAKVSGGGRGGQVEAVTYGIAKTLNKLDPEKFRSVLKKAGLLTRDARVRQRRMVGTGGKARRKKQSPKR